MRISDWSSDVCSSDLVGVDEARQDERVGQMVDSHRLGNAREQRARPAHIEDVSAGEEDQHFLDVGVDQTSDALGKSVSVRVDMCGRRLINKKQKEIYRSRRIPTN